MKKVYKVAGHNFAVIMPENDRAWEVMQCYEPFLVEDPGNYVFTAELVDAMPDTSDKKKVTTNCEGYEFPRFDLYEWEGLWLFEGAPTFEAPVRFYMITDKAFTKARFRILGSTRFSLNTVMMLMYAFATERQNTFLMHSSVVVKDGKGYLFLGKSGTGKSTHTQLWINNLEECELLNDDNPVLRIEENGVTHVYGSPWSGKTPCYRNLDYPVGAIVDLHQAKENKIRRLSVVEAYATMYLSSSGIRFLKDLADGMHATAEKIISSVPCYSLDCLPNAEAAFLCHKTVTQ
jgi:hypothetical protein